MVKKSSLADNIDAGIRSVRQEGLEPSHEALEMLEKVKKGEMTLAEYKATNIAKYKK